MTASRSKICASRGSGVEVSRLRPAFFLVIALLFAPACSKYVPVEGTVTLNGAVVDGTTVVFTLQQPADASAKPVQASAVTNAEGRFRLHTGNQKGVLPGTYKVTLSKRALPAGVKEPTNFQEAMAVAGQMHEAIPAPYLAIGTTPLEVEVGKRGNTDVKLDLKQ